MCLDHLSSGGPTGIGSYPDVEAYLTDWWPDLPWSAEGQAEAARLILADTRFPAIREAVLAAHGLTSNHRSWGVVAEALGGAVTLIAPDLRGRGRSNGLPGPFGVAAHADDLAMVLDHIGADQVVVTGHSMGGFIASMFAVRHAARARELVLVESLEEEERLQFVGAAVEFGHDFQLSHRVREVQGCAR